MAETIAFDRTVKGWTSRYSFTPDTGISLNNNFYTFKRGRIWRHNSESENRNTFYNVYDETIVEFIFNDDPSIVKNFKTLAAEADGDWQVTIETDVESGEIAAAAFVDKQNKKYAYIKGEAFGIVLPDLEGSSIGGIGMTNDIETVVDLALDAGTGDAQFQVFSSIIDTTQDLGIDGSARWRQWTITDTIGDRLTQGLAEYESIAPVVNITFSTNTDQTEYMLTANVVDIDQDDSTPHIYLWGGGETTQTISVTEDGMYMCTVTGDDGLIASDSIEVMVNIPPTATLTLPVQITPGDDATATVSIGDEDGTSGFTDIMLIRTGGDGTNFITADNLATLLATGSVSVTVTVPNAGDNEFVFTGTDSRGGTFSETRSVNSSFNPFVAFSTVFGTGDRMATITPTITDNDQPVGTDHTTEWVEIVSDIGIEGSASHTETVPELVGFTTTSTAISGIGEDITFSVTGGVGANYSISTQPIAAHSGTQLPSSPQVGDTFNLTQSATTGSSYTTPVFFNNYANVGGIGAGAVFIRQSAANYNVQISADRDAISPALGVLATPITVYSRVDSSSPWIVLGPTIDSAINGNPNRIRFSTNIAQPILDAIQPGYELGFQQTLAPNFYEYTSNGWIVAVEGLNRISRTATIVTSPQDTTLSIPANPIGDPARDIVFDLARGTGTAFADTTAILQETIEQGQNVVTLTLDAGSTGWTFTETEITAVPGTTNTGTMTRGPQTNAGGTSLQQGGTVTSITTFAGVSFVPTGTTFDTNAAGNTATVTFSIVQPNADETATINQVVGVNSLMVSTCSVSGGLPGRVGQSNGPTFAGSYSGDATSVTVSYSGPTQFGTIFVSGAGSDFGPNQASSVQPWPIGGVSGTVSNPGVQYTLTVSFTWPATATNTGCRGAATQQYANF